MYLDYCIILEIGRIFAQILGYCNQIHPIFTVFIRFVFFGNI